MVASKLKVSVIIPSWNSEKQLAQNLPYVYRAAAQVNAEIIVVDDASSHDKSVEVLKAQGGKIRFYKNESNRGFGYTVNRGVNLAKGDIVILLNTDVRPDQACFANALARFADPSLYAVTFNSGEGWAGCKWEKGMFHHLQIKSSSANQNTVNPSLYASGGQAAFNRAKWLKLGGMDLLYEPFYWEDVDMGYRAWKRGWHIIWDPNCKCVHDHRASVIGSSFSPQLVREIAQRNQFLFIWKNILSIKLMLSHLLRFPLFIKSYPSAFFKALLLFPKALTGRKIEKLKSVMTDEQVLSLWRAL